MSLAWARSKIFFAASRLRILGVHRDQNAAVLDCALIALRFVLGNPESYQSAGESAYRAASRGSGKSGQNWSGRYQRADAGDRKATDADQPAKRAS